LNCPEVREELGAYAIGALSDDEARQIEAHLATCAECTAEAIAYADAATALPLSVPALTPPASLRRRVLDAVAAPTPLRRRRSIVPWAGAAAAVVIAGLLGWNLWLQFGDGSESPDDQLAALMRKQDTAFTIMQGDGTWAIYAWEPEPKRGHLYARDLPDLPDGMIYEFWYVTEDGAVSGGTFEPAGDGYTHAATVPARETGRPSGYAVSVEPVDGTEEPEGEIVLTGEVVSAP
jgi:anti-sigma-K factor RskA